MLFLHNIKRARELVNNVGYVVPEEHDHSAAIWSSSSLSGDAYGGSTLGSDAFLLKLETPLTRNATRSMWWCGSIATVRFTVVASVSAACSKKGTRSA